MIKGFCPECSAKLEREGKVVYGSEPEDKETYSALYGEGNNRYSTHKALLINIEPIEVCTHPKEKVFKKKFLSIGPASEGKTPGEYYKCECGARVKPSVFEVVG